MNEHRKDVEIEAWRSGRLARGSMHKYVVEPDDNNDLGFSYHDTIDAAVDALMADEDDAAIDAAKGGE